MIRINTAILIGVCLGVSLQGCCKDGSRSSTQNAQNPPKKEKEPVPGPTECALDPAAFDHTWWPLNAVTESGRPRVLGPSELSLQYEFHNSTSGTYQILVDPTCTISAPITLSCPHPGGVTFHFSGGATAIPEGCADPSWPASDQVMEYELRDGHLIFNENSTEFTMTRSAEERRENIRILVETAYRETRRSLPPFFPGYPIPMMLRLYGQTVDPTPLQEPSSN